MAEISPVAEDNILTLRCFSEQHAAEVAERVPSELFATRAHRNIAEKAVQYLEKYNKPPRVHIRDLLETELTRTNEEGRLYRQIIDAMEKLAPDLHPEYVLSELDTFIELRRLIKAIEKASDAAHDGKLDDAKEVFRVTTATFTPPIKIEPIAWPEALWDDALIGLGGDFVRLVSPQTEADPAALLFQFLVAFGIYVGRGPYYRNDRDTHHTNMYAIITGNSSRARKGISWGYVRDLFIFDEHKHWFTDCIFTAAMSTGEGLIHAVRDRVPKWDRDEQKEIIVDPGIADKRLLVMTTRLGGKITNGFRFRQLPPEPSPPKPVKVVDVPDRAAELRARFTPSRIPSPSPIPSPVRTAGEQCLWGVLIAVVKPELSFFEASNIVHHFRNVPSDTLELVAKELKENHRVDGIKYHQLVPVIAVMIRTVSDLDGELAALLASRKPGPRRRPETIT